MICSKCSTDNTITVLRSPSRLSVVSEVMHAGFATRLTDLLKALREYRARGIMETIRKADALLLDTEFKLRAHYEFLSEFAHPNHYGILELYSRKFYEPFRIEFGANHHQKENILAQLRVALAVLVLVDVSVGEVAKLVPEIASFVPPAAI